jgi:hypothetical protein
MRRSLLAVAVLLTVTASPTFAGYLIIRVLLEGSSGGGAAPAGPGTPPMPGSGSSLGPMPGGPKQGSGFGPPGGISGPPPMPGNPGMPMGPTTPGAAIEFDHSRSVVVIIPFNDLKEEPLDKSKGANSLYNPKYKRLVVPHYDKILQASLFVDSSSIQLYEELVAQPGPKATRASEMRAKHAAWARNKTDVQLLYDALVLALESGIIRDPILPKDRSKPKDAMHFAQELLDVAAEKKLTLPADVQRFVTAWAPMSDAVKQPAPLRSDAENWKVLVEANTIRVDRHYALIAYDSPPEEIERRSAQLNDNFVAFFLWHATRGVALPVPKQPLTVVLAKDTRENLPQLRLALDCLSTQTDAFYSPDHNILVLAPERLDDVGQTFFRQSQQAFKRGLTRDRLLAGDIPKLDPTGEKDSKPDDVARATTIALVEKLVTEEAEVASVSREGTRQLMFTTGALPKHVTLPNWLTEGAVNSFARPRGPAYVTVGDDDKPFMTVTFATGYGTPNYVLQRYFRDLDVHKELNANRAKLLEHVLTDAYFAGLKDAVDPDPAPPTKKKPTGPVVPPKGPPGPGMPPMPPMPGGAMGPTGGGSSLGPPPMPGGVVGSGMGPGMVPGAVITTDSEDPAVTLRKKRDRLTIKSQATSWALYYYLARAKPEELKQYVAELNKLPRDLPIDGQTAYAAFVRVFKLSVTPDGPADPAKMQKFAKDWLDYMNTVPTVGIDIPLVVPEPPKAGTGTGPGVPPMPGGSMGPRPGQP